MKQAIRVVIYSFLVGQLLISGCVNHPTISKPVYQPLLHGKPLPDETLINIQRESPKDAVFADLLQAFALMRSADITNRYVQKKISGLLETSVNSFEDMADPVNFNVAFSADEDKPFRGWPYERMFASTMAGIFHMANNNCAQAMPYLRNAEFLDARFQKVPFGTDAPLIYALMYRCLTLENAEKADIARAQEGIFRSVRFLTMQEPLIDALVKLATIDFRPMAVINRIAYMIYEISIYHSLMTAPDNYEVDALLDDAARHASLFILSLKTNFEDEYKTKIRPLIAELAKVYRVDHKDGVKYLEEMSFDSVNFEVKGIADKLKRLFMKHQEFRMRAHEASLKTKSLTKEIVRAASSDKMILSFLGYGPQIVRQGSYEEIAVVKPSSHGTTEPHIRERNLKVNRACGFHRSDSQGGFSVVLCKAGLKDDTSTQNAVMPSLELLSLSRKATTAQGRRFDAVLKGRAQFRAATEKAAEITAWSAFILFHLGAQMIGDCQRRHEPQSCYTKGYVLWAIAGATAIFSGTAWLIGRTKNPAADSRYIHLMYESVYLSI